MRIQSFPPRSEKVGVDLGRELSLLERVQAHGRCGRSTAPSRKSRATVASTRYWDLVGPDGIRCHRSTEDSCSMIDDSWLMAEG